MSEIPQYAVTAVELLVKNGFEAYFVGGCVRDYIMNISVHDFDVTTSANPSQIKQVFDKYKTILTGEKHGTVAVMIDGNYVEITTYRIDKEYTDGRHPDSVVFSTSLEEDLKRRDFTINSMAMSVDGKIIDIFGGLKDIQNSIIRAVGNPIDRIEEDALRIMRALRFAARFGFKLDENTSRAVLKSQNLLKNISAERIRNEFIGLLCGKYAVDVLRKYRDVIAVFIPEIEECFGFEQHSPYHKYDVWEHTIRAVQSCANKENVKISMFFHDISKPECFKPDENGRGHFKGHALKSAQKTEIIMKRMKFSNHTISTVKTLIMHHSDELNSKYKLKKIVGQIGAENVFDLLDIQRADSLSKHDFCRERLKKSDEQEDAVKKILCNNECVSIKGLEINGNDLMKLGFKGAEIRQTLEKLLDEVMMENIDNNNKVLINCAKAIKIK